LPYATCNCRRSREAPAAVPAAALSAIAIALPRWAIA
jgi:hypothetical protein